MNKLLLTNYDGYNYIVIYNGFSFGCHAIDADYMFVSAHDNIKELEEKLSKYDVIYYSATSKKQIDIVEPLLKKFNWVLGGPYFDNRRGYKSFGDEIGIVEDDTFTPYWNEWLKTKKVDRLQYMALCKCKCYWGKCLYCKGIYYNNEKTRNIEKVLSQLPVYTFPSEAYFIAGLATPEELRTILEYKGLPDNLKLRIQIKAEEKIFEVINKADSLKNLRVNVGMENFCEYTARLLNKGVTIRKTLEFVKLCIDKKADVLVNIIPLISKYDEKEIDESLSWIIENFPKNVAFSVYPEIEWPDIKTAEIFGEYHTEKDDPMSRKPVFYSERIISKMKQEDIRVGQKILKTLSDNGYSISFRDEILSYMNNRLVGGKK